METPLLNIYFQFLLLLLSDYGFVMFDLILAIEMFHILGNFISEDI